MSQETAKRLADDVQRLCSGHETVDVSVALVAVLADVASESCKDDATLCDVLMEAIRNTRVARRAATN